VAVSEPPGIEIARHRSRRQLALQVHEFRRDASDHAARDAILGSEHVALADIERIRPEILAVIALDEVRIDAHPIGGAPDRAADHVAGAQFVAHGGRFDVPRIAAARAVADHRKPAPAGQPGDQVLDHPLGEVIVGVRIELAKRQHRDGRSTDPVGDLGVHVAGAIGIAEQVPIHERRFGAVGNPEAAEHRGDVNLDGVARNAEQPADVAIGQAFRDQTEYFHLTGRQLRDAVAALDLGHGRFGGW
jgi:hypothetical protein